MDSWQDITAPVLACARQLEFLQIVRHNDLTLEDTMHAHQINDPKIDPKFDLNFTHTVGYMFMEGTLRLPHTLSVNELRGVYGKIFQLQALLMQTQPLAQTVHTFTYLYDDAITRESSLVLPLVESVHTWGRYIQELHRDSCSIKEDDLSFATATFKTNSLPHDQVIQLLLKSEKEIQGIVKKVTDQQVQTNGKELLALVKVRRALHSLAKLLGKNYEPKLIGKIETEFKSLKKRIAQAEVLVEKSTYVEDLPQGVFSSTINKTLRTHFGPRDVGAISLAKSIEQLKNGIDQLELFIPAPTRLSDYRNKLDILSYKPLNLWSKAYLKLNIFSADGNTLMRTVKTEQALLADMKEWAPAREQVRNDPKFQNLIALSYASVGETLYRMVGRNSRWFWECSKAYDDFNVMIHLGNEVDAKFSEKKKDIYASSWFYQWAGELMVRQILWGFQEDLYEPTEYHYVAYHLEHILHVCQKNSIVFMTRIDTLDRSFSQSLYEGTLAKNKKRKKLLTELQRKFFANCFFLKGLRYYFRAFSRLLVVLMQRGLLADPFSEQAEQRINNRFRIFKGVMFMKKLDFDSYRREKEMIANEQAKIVEEADELLKAARTIFGKFTQFEEGETFFRQREEAAILEKLSVKLSLVVITLKLKQARSFALGKEYARFPEIRTF